MKHYFCIDMVLFFFYLKEIAKLSWAYKLASATEGPKKKKRENQLARLFLASQKELKMLNFKIDFLGNMF